MKQLAIPGSWKWATLAEVAGGAKNAIVDGPFGSNLKTSDYVEEGVPVLQGKNITGDTFKMFDIRFLTERKAKELDRSSVAVGDILMIKIGSIGYAAIVGSLDGFDRAIIPANMAKVTPDPSKVDAKYLHRWLTTNEVANHLRSVASQTAQPALSLTKIKELPVPLPPLPEQKKIAAILDKADELRAKRRAALAELDTLAQSIFLEMFGDPATNPKGWKTCTIRDLLGSASYGTSEKASESGQYPVLRMNNITRTGEVDLRDLKYMDLGDDQKERYLVRAGDVLFNRTNSAELVGKTAIFRDTQEMAYAGYLVRLRVNKENHPEYLAAFLNTDYAKRVLRGMCKSIIGMANINAKEVQGINIHKVPLPLQQKFASHVVTVERHKTSLRRSLAELDELFASLQHRAFRGAL